MLRVRTLPRGRGSRRPEDIGGPIDPVIGAALGIPAGALILASWLVFGDHLSATSAAIIIAPSGPCRRRRRHVLVAARGDENARLATMLAIVTATVVAASLFGGALTAMPFEWIDPTGGKTFTGLSLPDRDLIAREGVSKVAAIVDPTNEVQATASLWLDVPRGPDGRSSAFVGHFASTAKEHSAALLNDLAHEAARAGRERILAPDRRLDLAQLPRRRRKQRPRALLPRTAIAARLGSALPRRRLPSRRNVRLARTRRPGAFAGVDDHAQDVAAAGITVRDFDMHHFDVDLVQLHKLSLDAFASNPYYAPLSFAEFAAMYRPAVFLYEPGLALIAEKDGEAIGFIFAYRDGAKKETTVMKTIAVSPTIRAVGSREPPHAPRPRPRARTRLRLRDHGAHARGQQILQLGDAPRHGLPPLRADGQGSVTATSNIVATLGAYTERTPHATAIIAGTGSNRRTLTFDEVNRLSATWAATLAANGVRAGDHVLVLQSISVELYLALLAVFRIGAIAVFPDPQALQKTIEAACNSVQSRRHDRRLARASAAPVHAPLRRIKRTFSAARVPWATRLPKRQGHEAPIANVPADQPALVTFTSGSTGAPKVIARSHAFLTAQHLAITRAVDFVPGTATLTALPVFVLSHLASGVASILPASDVRKPKEIDPGPLLAQIAENKAADDPGLARARRPSRPRRRTRARETRKRARHPHRRRPDLPRHRRSRNARDAERAHSSGLRLDRSRTHRPHRARPNHRRRSQGDGRGQGPHRRQTDLRHRSSRSCAKPGACRARR